MAKFMTLTTIRHLKNESEASSLCLTLICMFWSLDNIYSRNEWADSVDSKHIRCGLNSTGHSLSQFSSE